MEEKEKRFIYIFYRKDYHFESTLNSNDIYKLIYESVDYIDLTNNYIDHTNELIKITLLGAYATKDAVYRTMNLEAYASTSVYIYGKNNEYEIRYVYNNKTNDLSIYIIHEMEIIE